MRRGTATSRLRAEAASRAVRTRVIAGEALECGDLGAVGKIAVEAIGECAGVADAAVAHEGLDLLDAALFVGLDGGCGGFGTGSCRPRERWRWRRWGGDWRGS